MKNIHSKKGKVTAALTAALITGSIASAMAGQPPKKLPAPEKPAANPLSFADGILTFDFQERVRFESRENNFDFTAKASPAPGGPTHGTDDSWALQRLRLGLTVKPTSWFKVYVQGQDSRELFSDRQALDNRNTTVTAEGNDAFDLRQAYVELADYKKCPWGLKLGRQVLSYGDERLVGGFEWNNIARTFDAAKLTYKGKGWAVDVFAATPVVPVAGEFNQSDFLNGTESARGEIFSGIYLTLDPIPYGTLDLYAFQLNSNSGGMTKAPLGVSTVGTLPGATFKAGSDFTTFGTRIKGDPKKLNGWEYSGEFAYQTGRVQGLDLTAYAVSVGGGYNFKLPMSPRLYAEYNFATGDKDSTDGSLQTFQNLFPTNHKFYGMMDVFSWQNMHNILLSGRINVTKTVTAQLDYNAFWMAQNGDKHYRANGYASFGGVGGQDPGAGGYEGSELDAVVTWNAKKNLQIQGGVAYYVPGQKFKNQILPGSVGHADARFAYLQATVNF
ncbi:MAG: alginate export family protein [Verrucomicrobiota bacterium]